MKEKSFIFYKNGSSEKLTFDFGTNNLHTGSGTARYLRFSSTGQSATIILIDKSSGKWYNKCWCTDIMLLYHNPKIFFVKIYIFFYYQLLNR